MITIEMINAAVYSFLGLSALNVALTQVFKDLFKSDKRWQNHLIAFITSLVTCGAVLAIGIFNHIGIFAEFCTSCVSSWTLFAGIVISCTFISNGQWSYEVAKQFLELIGLLTRKPEPESNSEATKTIFKAEEGKSYSATGKYHYNEDGSLTVEMEEDKK